MGEILARAQESVRLVPAVSAGAWLPVGETAQSRDNPPAGPLANHACLVLLHRMT
jgi:hypothetical protein